MGYPDDEYTCTHDHVRGDECLAVHVTPELVDAVTTLPMMAPRRTCWWTRRTSMREVVGRRYRRLLEEGKDLPDLVLIDGGAGQLSSPSR